MQAHANVCFYLRYRANDQDRTGDLILTMDVLYQLSYIGSSPSLTIR